MREQSHGNLNPAEKQVTDPPHRGPMGDARPNESDPDPRARGVEKPRSVEDRPAVSSVTPASYPDGQRAKG